MFLCGISFLNKVFFSHLFLITNFWLHPYSLGATTAGSPTYLIWENGTFPQMPFLTELPRDLCLLLESRDLLLVKQPWKPLHYRTTNNDLYLFLCWATLCEPLVWQSIYIDFFSYFDYLLLITLNESLVHVTQMILFCL